MMPVNHVQSCVSRHCFGRCWLLPQSESSRMLTAGDLTATGVTVHKQFLNVTHSPLNVISACFKGFVSCCVFFKTVFSFPFFKLTD